MGVGEFYVLEPSINFSDHLPLIMSCVVTVNDSCSNEQTSASAKTQRFPRWDKADLGAFYQYTGDKFMLVLRELDAMCESESDAYDNSCLDVLYDAVVSTLIEGENQLVPIRGKHFYKFWWNEELTLFKQMAIDAYKAWKAAGKPRSGLVFNNRQRSRLQYRKLIKEYQQAPTSSYTNDLHEALLKKNGTAFWKCWQSNCEPSFKCYKVENCVDPDVIVSKFAVHFSRACSANDESKEKLLYNNYCDMRANYSGLPLQERHAIDTELVSSVISRLQRGKAADNDGVSAEHLMYSHPSICVVLYKLFNLIMQHRYVPSGFRNSYIVPIPKIKDC